MYVKGAVSVNVNSLKWQGYRGNEMGLAVYYDSDPVSELPIREIPEEYPTKVIADPNYETSTYGLYGCKFGKNRNTIIKKKYKYIFFMTKYAGTNMDLRDELLCTGFYRIKYTFDAKKFHSRSLDSVSCMTENSCQAVRADEMVFVAAEDAFHINEERLKEWGGISRVTRQTKILLTEEQTEMMLSHLRGQENIVEQYIDETNRLLPATDEEAE